MSAGPALLFGLGATRAGTSWLHRWLDEHPEAHVPAVKELHYFDVVETGGWEWWTAHAAARREAFAGRLPAARSTAWRASLARTVATYDALLALFAARRPDDAAYLALLGAGAAPGVRLLADITPAYGLLSEAALARMQALAPETRFVYVLRDPVARLWSNIRQATPARRNGTTDPEGKARRILDRFLAGQEPEIARRCDYAGALTRIGRAIRPENRLVLFYETLFEEATLRRLAAFLGIGFRAADPGRRVNEAIALPLDPGRAAAARAALKPQYDFVHEAFGDEVPLAWRTEPAEV